MNATNGDQLWVHYVDGEVTWSPALDGGAVYAGGCYAFDATSGNLLWDYSICHPGLDDLAVSPAVANGVVCFSAFSGIFYALVSPESSLSPTSTLAASPSVAASETGSPIPTHIASTPLTVPEFSGQSIMITLIASVINLVCSYNSKEENSR